MDTLYSDKLSLYTYWVILATLYSYLLNYIFSTMFSSSILCMFSNTL